MNNLVLKYIIDWKLRENTGASYFAFYTKHINKHTNITLGISKYYKNVTFAIPNFCHFTNVPLGFSSVLHTQTDGIFLC